jgi:hypothetical protein
MLGIVPGCTGMFAGLEYPHASPILISVLSNTILTVLIVIPRERLPNGGSLRIKPWRCVIKG